MWRSLGRSAAVVTVALAANSCATLENLRQLVQAPTFEEAENQPAEIRLEPSAPGRPLGGATVRLWTRVRNPNPFGVTLTTLDGTLLLEGSRAATASRCFRLLRSFRLLRGFRLPAEVSAAIVISLAPRRQI